MRRVSKGSAGLCLAERCGVVLSVAVWSGVGRCEPVEVEMDVCGLYGSVGWGRVE